MNATDRAIDFSARAIVPKHVLIQEVAGQSAILDLQADKYFGLDDVATEIWRSVTGGSTVAQGIDSVAALYDVEYEILQNDVIVFLTRLRDLGLLEFE